MRNSSALVRFVLCTTLSLTLTQYTFSIDFDPNFGTGGKFISVFAAGTDPSSSATQVFIQGPGRIVVVGSHSEGSGTIGIGLLGLTPAGSPDHNFGVLGKTLLWNASYHRFPANAVMTGDNSLLVLHQFWQSATDNRPAIARFAPNGTFDPTFDPNLDIAPNGTTPVRMVLGREGKIYVLVRTGPQHYLMRLNFDGTRDATFGDNGVQTIGLKRFSGPFDPYPRIFGLEELSTGKILIGGYYNAQAFDESPAFVTRLNTDGNIDRTWGIHGATRMIIPGGSVAGVSMKVQPDGKVLVGGSWTFLGSTTFLARLTTRGRLDSGFGSAGIIRKSFGDTNVIRGISLQPDGKIVVFGNAGAKTLPSNQKVFVIRYSAAGLEESSFLASYLGTQDSTGYDIVREPHGDFIGCGYVRNATGFSTQLAVAKFR